MIGMVIMENIKVKDDYDEYKEYMCFERCIYYIYKNKFNIKDFELLFVDRYLGFTWSELSGWMNISDGMSKFLYNSNLIESKTIMLEDFEDFFVKHVKPNNYGVIATGTFLYQDKKATFPYSTYFIIEDLKDNMAVTTKLSNVKQEISNGETINNLKRYLEIKNGQIDLLIVKDPKILNEVGKLKCNKKIKTMLSLFEKDSNKLNSLFEDAILIDPIAEVFSYHNKNLNKYLRDGVSRNNYSNFARRIGEMIYPSIRFLDYIERFIDNDNLIICRNNLNSRIQMTQNTIMIFFHKNEVRYFEQYLGNMQLLGKTYKEYRINYNNQIMKQLE